MKRQISQKEKTWSKTLSQKPSHAVNDFLQLIPESVDDEYKTNSNNSFTRKRQLPLPKLITFILSITCSGKTQGVDGKIGKFIKQAQRDKLWDSAETVDRSAITRGRAKLSYKFFESLLSDAVDLAYSLLPDSPEYTWHGRNVFGIDGSKYNLPATQELRESFDPESGLEYQGKGHYPQCLVSTVCDVFRQLPIARTVMPIAEGNEREEAEAMLEALPLLPLLLLFDRGYPSYKLIKCLLEHEQKPEFVFRCPASSTFPVVEKFVRSGKREDIIYINATDSYKRNRSHLDRHCASPLRLRIVRLDSPDGTVSVLLTNLFDKTEFSAESIIELYFRRWKIEEHYRNEKTYIDIERFHSRTENGIRQEMFAVLVMCVIARIMMDLAVPKTLEVKYTPQFKNAIISLALDAAVLTPDDPISALHIFEELLEEIARVKYYKPKIPRKSQPRVSHKPINKWQQSKARRKDNA